MTWPVLARQEGRLTAESRTVKILLGLLGVGIVVAAYVYPIVGDEPFTTARFSGFVSGWVTTVVPLVGVMLGYNAVVSERESGALQLHLSLPYSRKALVVGKLAGRVGVLAATILLAMVGAGVLVVYPFGTLALAEFLGFVALTVVFGIVWTAIGVAVSLAVATKQRAIVLGFGLFALFTLVWDPLGTAVELGLRAAGLIGGELPGPARFVLGLTPGNVFDRLTAGFIDPSASLAGPWYLSEWVALVLLGCWTVGPLWLAYRRFAGRDIA
jgi:ABC-2 type transport system permease protein